MKCIFHECWESFRVFEGAPFKPFEHTKTFSAKCFFSSHSWKMHYTNLRFCHKNMHKIKKKEIIKICGQVFKLTYEYKVGYILWLLPSLNSIFFYFFIHQHILFKKTVCSCWWTRILQVMVRMSLTQSFIERARTKHFCNVLLQSAVGLTVCNCLDSM